MVLRLLSHVAKLLGKNQTPAVTGNQENSSNTSAAIANVFRSDTLSHRHELGFFITEAHDIAHQRYYRGTFSVEYAYATTNLQESCLRRAKKEEITPNTFKEETSLSKPALWKEAADKEILSLEKHGVFEVVPIAFGPSPQEVVGIRWVNEIKAYDMIVSKAVWSYSDGLKSTVSIKGALTLPFAGHK